MIRQIAGYVKAAAKGSSCQLLMDSGVGFKKTAIFDGFYTCHAACGGHQVSRRIPCPGMNS
jgi:hypothetical protein